ncbi:phosphatase PAP2 family protein [Gordonia sp. SL306]|uniref:phosphatase PAP2 family protein n=1 Tax=Gordonia sp. SL306 TaxID=2995145 RepID=UPI00226F0EF1|nr:phosphatase PAP2 family protein [Gordonia sp. SL306]WAC56983.1 phosphatase PAP2 family protein [Gordonia sp. SL306]
MSTLRLRSAIISVLTPILLVTGLVASGVATAAPTVTTPAPFTPAELVGPYASDVPPSGTYIPVLDGFAGLRRDRPDIIASNLQMVKGINNSATRAQQADAISINYDDRLVSLSDALGDRLGTVFRQLLAAGKLPKVDALAGGDTARAGLPLGTTLLEKEYYDNPRPFVVAPNSIKKYNKPGGDLYADLVNNGSYPSGHTSMAYWKGALLAYWLPELGPQIIARAGEIGRSRMVLGVHYPLDVMSGRIMGTDIAAARLADPRFARLVDQAGAQLRAQLGRSIGMPLNDFIARDNPYLTTQQAVTEHRGMMTYGFPVVSPGQRNAIPASAAALLRSRFPGLTDAQRLDILRRTAIRSGYPLDQSGPNGGWLRIDLAAAYAVSP